MGLIRFIGSVTRRFTRIFVFAFLITLPITFFPLIIGVRNGIQFHFWYIRQVVSNTNALTREIERWGTYGHFSIPGALSMHDWRDQRDPFYISRLTTPDWHQKLGVIQPNEYAVNETTQDQGIDKLSSLSGIVRSPDCGDYGAKPSNYWVYITRMPEWIHSEWDNAFQTILERNYVDPLPDTGFYFLDCMECSFLCGVWGVYAPALMHFKVEEETLAQRKAKSADSDEVDWPTYLLEPDFTYHFPDTEVFPVTVRVVELPLTAKDGQNLLPFGDFPTPFRQLESIISSPLSTDVLSFYDEYSAIQQIIRRFQEFIHRRCLSKGTIDYYLSEMDEWYTNRFLTPVFGLAYSGGVLGEVQNFTFTVTIVFAAMIQFPCTWIWRLYAWYFGLGWNGEPLNNVVPADVANQKPSTMWDDLFAGFWEVVARNMSEKSIEDAARGAVTGAAQKLP